MGGVLSGHRPVVALELVVGRPNAQLPGGIRQVIYTTNTTESLNMTSRKVIKNRSLFPNDEAVFKLMNLAPEEYQPAVDDAHQELSEAMNQFAILFDGRVLAGGLKQNALTQDP